MIINVLRNYLARVGRKGGKVKSQAKRDAARKNGSKGGRPKDKSTKETTK